MTSEDEVRVIAALAELLAPLFIEVLRAGDRERGPTPDS